MKVGITREGQVPPDKRVPLTPVQCKELKEKYPDLELVVQPSPIRAFADDAYAAQGIELQEDLSDCDVIVGVKEVPKDMLLADKTYFFRQLCNWRKQLRSRSLIRSKIDWLNLV
jgi:saccharopine dehydrogenase (NAD+, L-lysine-forming)